MEEVGSVRRQASDRGRVEHGKNARGPAWRRSKLAERLWPVDRGDVTHRTPKRRSSRRAADAGGFEDQTDIGVERGQPGGAA